MGIFSRIKQKVRGEDDLAKLSDKEKLELNKMLKSRRLELIAQKQLRELERKYAPKEKSSVSETFAKINAYRKANLAKRQERISKTELAKTKFKTIEKARKGDLIGKVKPLPGKILIPKGVSTIGEKCRAMESERKRRISERRRM